MAGSLPSPEETCSDWSSSLSDCEASSLTSNTACMATDSGYFGCYPIASLPVGTGPQSQQQRSKPVAVLPSSPEPTFPSTGDGGSSPTPATDDGGPKPARIQTHNPRRRRYATEDDWRGHRDRISSLYQTKRLKDVIIVMETQYGFFATARMYKARFKEWGIEKNVTAAKVHKLMQRVEEERRRTRVPPAPGSTAPNERVVLDVGEDLDVKRIQKYMKRRPAGLEKLRLGSKRSLEVIKALAVDSGKGEFGRGRVSIAAEKLEPQAQQDMPRLFSPHLVLQWPPGSELPDEIVRLLQAFIENHFDCPYGFAPFPNTLSSPEMSSKWHSQTQHRESSPVDLFTSSFGQVSGQDEMMLDFVINFRIAHTLLDDGLTSEGMQALNVCLESLAFCIQQAQSSDPAETRPATRVVLWALSAASEMMSDFQHPKQMVLQMLLHRVAALCASYQPTMAELVRKISRLRAPVQAAMLKLARCSISQALYAAGDYGPAFETYSKTLSVAESPLSPEQKAFAIQALADDPVVQVSPILAAWMETQIALSASESSPPFIDPIGPSGSNMPPSWYGQGHSRMADVLGTLATRIEWNKAAGNWQLAQHLDIRYGLISETVWGCINSAASGPRLDVAEWGSPEQMTSSLAPVDPSISNMDIADSTLRMSIWMDGMPDWGQEQQQQGHVLAQSEASTMYVWDATHPSQWQADIKFEGDDGIYDGLC